MQHKKQDLKNVYLIVAKNIKRYRRLKRLTQKDLARLTGYSYDYIRRLEAPGCIKNFSIQTIYHIACVLDVDIGKLFIDDDI